MVRQSHSVAVILTILVFWKLMALMTCACRCMKARIGDIAILVLTESFLAMASAVAHLHSRRLVHLE